MKPTKRKSKKWFEPGPSLHWEKSQGQSTRRRNALAARRGNPLRAAKALQALSNVTTDEETHRKARADALYFFGLHRRKQKG